MSGNLILFDDRCSVKLCREPAPSVTKGSYQGAPSDPIPIVSHDQTSKSSSTIRTEPRAGSKGLSEEQKNLVGDDQEIKHTVPLFRSSDYKLVSNIFIGLMMFQYILIFFAIPFSEVDNRPAASVLLCLLGYLLVCSNNFLAIFRVDS
ncbi:hypothetical protein METBIDRAFT_178533 [Metschnikowia bicuspidata var. bicuspidata NRRL YB-4993]|uniref:Uncharacterized protein n=1 Tax=Metschnikowia bicuspidata var. bicuspidata NRRL YB-4993 TaxID=869754 RepID=A0A1A0HB53_9ASCO|nr:hypothetical protein METBIDRAFT_178533 [Metschnikowia bicuspidata var. bicuspidata NRRL YB-4993]OBA21241.1 hypothetical protein METBIDRAFT_178533 [Metschnikowia bicuspidata var. bicuspidata NRRL YB-4993]